MKIKKFKKADLSINMIIVAAIAIIVLLVVVMMFSGKMRIFGRAMQSCESSGGHCSGTIDYNCETNKEGCKDACSTTNPDKYIIIRNTDCEENGAKRICCKEIY